MFGDVCIGVKKRGILLDEGARPLRELAVGLQLGESSAMLMETLPIFNVGIRLSGEDIAILTEDFTMEGYRALYENDKRFSIRIKREALPDEYYRKIYDVHNGNVYSDAFGHCLGFDGFRRVLVDFDDISNVSREPIRTMLERVAQFPEMVYKDLDSFLDND